jgi:hypothetical protein
VLNGVDRLPVSPGEPAQVLALKVAMMIRPSVVTEPAT